MPRRDIRSFGIATGKCSSREGQRQQHGSGDASGVDEEHEHEHERMVSRAVLTSPVNASKRRSQDAERSPGPHPDRRRAQGYLSQEALHFLKYEEEKQAALSQQHQIKMGSGGLNTSAATDGSMITAREEGTDCRKDSSTSMTTIPSTPLLSTGPRWASAPTTKEVDCRRKLTRCFPCRDERQ